MALELSHRLMNSAHYRFSNSTQYLLVYTVTKPGPGPIRDVSQLLHGSVLILEKVSVLASCSAFGRELTQEQYPQQPKLN